MPDVTPSTLFTSESVTEGHPDKLCDAIADAVLDDVLANDPEARCAIEVATTTGLVLVLGEVSTRHWVDVQDVVRRTVREIGYTDSRVGFDWETCGTLTAIKAFMDDYTLYSLTPHMHQRGKAMTYVLTYPDGTERILLANLKYYFNWQIHYELKEPIKIPAGSTMKQIGYFDNSTANKWNPAPQSEVYWSEQSWDDMYSPFMDLSVDKFSKKRAMPVPVAPSSNNR